MVHEFPSNDRPVTTNEFQVLRKQTHQQMEPAIAQRIKQNPVPTEEELMVGAFREMIEPQVRDALFEFNRKGYPTESSGFGGEQGEHQSMDGYFQIDPRTIEALESMGVKVLHDRDLGWPGGGKRDAYTFVRFQPKSPDLKEIKKQWDAIAAIFPDLKQPMRPSTSGGSEEFRKEFAPERKDVERAALVRALETAEFEPTTEQKMKKRIAELSG